MTDRRGGGGRGRESAPLFSFGPAKASKASRPSGAREGSRGGAASGGREELRTGPPEGVAETVLDNGIRVLSERIPGVRSAAVGVWVRQGAAHEDGRRLGASHLLEHMVFKGTARRTPRELALALEGLGGSLDAYTGREHTSFQARVLGEHLPEALDVLADLSLSPLLREKDLELEREVVLEEISMVEDTPDDLVFDLHAQGLWRGHGYGHPILGTRESVSGISAEELRRLHREVYRGGNLVLGAAGDVEHAELVERARELFGEAPGGERRDDVAEPSGCARGVERVARDSAQSHILFGTDLVPHHDRRRYPLLLVSSALGGGMSSRLFQRVREELALAYTVFSFQSFYGRGGMGGVYVGTRPRWEEKAVEAVRGELGRLADEGLDAEELRRSKEQAKGQIMISLESTGSRLHRLAGLALYDEPWVGLDELLARIDAVTADEVSEVAAEFFRPERYFVLVLGPDG